MKTGHSGQKFKFDIQLILRLIEDMNSGKITVEELSQSNGLGDNKIVSYIEYLIKTDCIYKVDVNKYNLTKFGRCIHNIREEYNFVEPLLFYKLSRGEDNGGHIYFSILTNMILYDIAFKIENKTTLSNIIDLFELRFSEMTVANRQELLKQALNQGLSDTTTGFGKMGMVVQKDGIYEISGYIPDKLVTAYIIYDNWPKTRADLKLDEIVMKDYFPCKIFFMGQDLFMKQIEELASDRIIYIERNAGLNQIRLAPDLSADKILERIVESCQLS